MWVFLPLRGSTRKVRWFLKAQRCRSALRGPHHRKKKERVTGTSLLFSHTGTPQPDEVVCRPQIRVLFWRRYPSTPVTPGQQIISS